MEAAPWIRVRLPLGTSFDKIKTALRKRQLVTVCEEAHCPNIGECWQDEGTATFMLMGPVCTRGCRFCAVSSGKPGPLDPDEPGKLAEAIAEMELGYAVLTSVDRDDLPDGGAGHFALCINAIRQAHQETLIETLIPDFQGDALQKIIDARPTVIGHNIETVERLQAHVRDRRAGYQKSLHVLKTVKVRNPAIYTKSSLMLGLGETAEEVVQTMIDLRKNHVDIITIGQYLRPSKWHLPIAKFYRPEEFRSFEQEAQRLGFLFSACGPLVRSSYRAGELFIKSKGGVHEENIGHV
ncbi:lipoyl synthase [Candidatus Woesearchaeota archaeon]|nr:lipoyl synthase [Candidatus Woesearchaeota archaeon]